MTNCMAPPARAAATETDPGPRKSVGREYLESVVVAIMLALFIRTFIVQAFKIPTGSMEQNLLIGDHLLVNKLLYSPSAGAWEDALFAKRDVRRGDVIVFKFPEDPARDFIKRVVALPGETVAVRGKAIYINGKLLKEDYTFFGGNLGEPRKEQATGPEQLPPEAAENPRTEYLGPQNHYGPKVVPANQLFVLGDNRDNSRDSRFWDFLPRDQVKGRALLVYWSYEAKRDEYGDRSAFQWLKDTASALGKTRWSRFFHLIR
jgi:signal peptidase I